jgi:hypothetical protein
MSKHGAILDGWSIGVSYGPNTWSLDNGYKNEFLIALRGVASAYPETKQVLNEPISFLLKEAAERIAGKAQ